MPSPKVLASAWEDLSAIVDAREASAGRRSAGELAERILSRIDLLGTMPELGPLHQDPELAVRGYRKLLARPYVVIYRVVDGTPTIYRIFHGATNYQYHVMKDGMQ